MFGKISFSSNSRLHHLVLHGMVLLGSSFMSCTTSPSKKSIVKSVHRDVHPKKEIDDREALKKKRTLEKHQLSAESVTSRGDKAVNAQPNEVKQHEDRIKSLEDRVGCIEQNFCAQNQKVTEVEQRFNNLIFGPSENAGSSEGGMPT